MTFLKSISLLSVMATIPVFSQKYEINITLKSRNDTAVLGYYFAKSEPMLAYETIVLKNGKGVFRGDKKMPKGMYFIYNDKKKFDIIIGDQQEFSIVADTADFINKTKFTSSPDNEAFFEFNRYNTERGKLFQQLAEQYRNATSETERSDIGVKMQTLRRERIEYIEKLADANNHLYVSKFLRTLVPPETHLPEPPRDDQGNITDSTYAYRWYRAHFFDNLNIFDPDMLRNPFYEEKLLEFMTRVIPQHTDTICAEADKILTKVKANDEIFRCVLVSLFNHYVKSTVIVQGNVVPENVWIHLAEKWYIPHATFSSEEYLETLKSEVEKKRSNLIGQPAPPMEMLMVLPPEHFRIAAADTSFKFDLHAGRMYDDFRKGLLGKYTAIVFWDYSCGHCKKAMEEMFQVYETHKNKGFTVITVQTVNTKEAKGKWIDFINEHQMFGWTNAWSPYSNKYRDYYNVSMTPLFFLLDEKGTILLNRITAEHINNFLETHQ